MWFAMFFVALYRHGPGFAFGSCLLAFVLAVGVAMSLVTALGKW
jgi:hypothetical protein